MKILLINAKRPDEFANVPHIRELIQLCHISNALDYMTRQTIQTYADDGSTASKRNTAYALMFVSSLIYEGMSTASSLLKKMAEIMPEFIRPEVAWIITEAESSSSFCNTVLGRIRNQVAFHFGDGLIRQPLELKIPHFPPVLAEAQHEDGIDLVFTLPADIFTGYLASFGDQSKSSEQQIQEVVGQIANYSARLLRVIHNAILAITSEDSSDYTIEEGNTA